MRSGVQKAASKSLGGEHDCLQRQEEFPCDATKSLNRRLVENYLPNARSKGTWQRKHSWLLQFYAFARKICAQSKRFRTKKECLASVQMCRHFITHVADEGKGFTRARSARTVLSVERAKIGCTSLSLDPDISMVVRGAESAEPRTKKQSPGVTIVMVRRIYTVWGDSRYWWKRQIATVIVVGFVTIMRMGELCALSRSGIWAIYSDGSEANLADLERLPSASILVGLLLHLPWRKNHVATDCWIPVACKRAVALILRQLHTLNANRCQSDCLFPSRRGAKMHKRNRLSTESARKALKHALLECVPLMTRQWAKLYTGHALRVGGSNRMRRLGIAEDIHRCMGGWFSLVAAQGYMAMTPMEQIKYTLRLAKRGAREAGLSKDSARSALAGITALAL